MILAPPRTTVYPDEVEYAGVRFRLRHYDPHCLCGGDCADRLLAEVFDALDAAVYQYLPGVVTAEDEDAA